MAWEEDTIEIDIKANMIFVDMVDTWQNMHLLSKSDPSFMGALEARELTTRFQMHSWYLVHLIKPARWNSTDQVQEDFRNVYIAMTRGRTMTPELLHEMAGVFFGTGK